jgi:putative salt-induced outer membrane protein YdiY
MFTQFEEQKPVYGMVVISNELVIVNGAEPLALHRDLLMGITPSGRKGISDWSGNFNLGLSIQSGNNSQTTLSTSAELARRTPNTTFLIDYLGNYSQVNNVQSADNKRVNLTYDVRLNHEWFVRPLQFEYYQDSLANISYRLTAGVGAGYYIFDRTGLEWQVTAGPSFQYTKFETVETNQDDSATTPAAVLTSNFKADLTQRLTFIQAWQSTFTERAAGTYNHHAVSTLEFEIKRHLNLDVSFIWDYLQNPQQKSDGTIPQNSDYYLTVGFGVRF